MSDVGPIRPERLSHRLVIVFRISMDLQPWAELIQWYIHSGCRRCACEVLLSFLPPLCAGRRSFLGVVVSDLSLVYNSGLGVYLL